MITSFTAGDNLTCIDWNAFEHCSNLQTVTVGSGLERIWGNAFNYCFKLKDFYSSSLHEIDFNPTYSPFYYGAAITFHGPHGSGLLPIIQNYPNCSFDVTDRHQEPEWSWSEDMRSAVARFDCGGTCTLSPCILTDTEIEVTVGPTCTVYTASVTLEGDEYIDVRSISYWAALQAQIDAATIRLSGSLEISGDPVSVGVNDLFLGREGFALEIVGALTNTAPIPVSLGSGLTRPDQLVFTSGLAGSGTAESFVSVSDEYLVFLTDAGEAALAAKSEVVFVPGEGAGDMEPVTVACGSPFSLPACDFDAPTGKIFVGRWIVEQLDSLDEADAEAVENGITAGTSETTFSPGSACTRAQIVAFLWRAAGSPAPTAAENPFLDVSSDAWYAKAVAWALENGITAGTGPDAFSPGQTCTRAEAVSFLYARSRS